MQVRTGEFESSARTCTWEWNFRNARMFCERNFWSLASGALSTHTREWNYNEIVNNLDRIQVKDLLAFIISVYYAVSLPDALS